MDKPLGLIALDHGRFEAFLREPRGARGERSPSMRVQYRLRTDASDGAPIIAAVRAKCGDRGKLWTSTKTGNVGWTVQKAEDLRWLSDRFLNGARQREHPRLPLIEAWSACVDLLPAIARLENPGTYKPRLFVLRRVDAVAEFNRVRACTPFFPEEKLRDFEV